jgi:hypothetical protein
MGSQSKKCTHGFKCISDTMWTTLNKTWYGGKLLTWGDSSASEEHEVFYTPPQSPQRGELVDLERV